MKKLINRPEQVVEEMIEGLVAVDPRLVRLPGRTVVVRADLERMRGREVGLISGGGSGHEPAHAGYVGPGMLTAAVAGDVFTSPGTDAILAAIRAVGGGPGVLLVVKNYTGDRLNFGLAAERARAEGIAVETVVVADDVALASAGDHAGRRGLAGTVFVHKVAGAAAGAGGTLAEVAAEARAAAAEVRTIGVALSPCTTPAAGRPGFTLGDDEIEIGLGIHGEPGVRRGPLLPADGLVDAMLARVAEDASLASGDRIALMVNNLGSTPAMELSIVARGALAWLEGRGVIVERAYVGTFLSALEMAGVSLSVLRVDDARLARLDAPTEAPAWHPAPPRPPGARPSPFPAEVPALAEPKEPRTNVGRTLRLAILDAAEALERAAPGLTELDRLAGDGDFGDTLNRGIRAVRAEIAAYPTDDPASALESLSLTLERAMGGTSGVLNAVFFLRAATALRALEADDPRSWAAALRAGCTGIADLGGARRGDRTMLDALLPAADAFESALDAGRSAVDALRSAVDAARAGAQATAEMTPHRGRASYLGDRALGHPDPGAVAVSVWLEALRASVGDGPIDEPDRG